MGTVEAVELTVFALLLELVLLMLYECCLRLMPVQRISVGEGGQRRVEDIDIPLEATPDLVGL